MNLQAPARRAGLYGSALALALSVGCATGTPEFAAPSPVTGSLLARLGAADLKEVKAEGGDAEASLVRGKSAATKTRAEGGLAPAYGFERPLPGTRRPSQRDLATLLDWKRPLPRGARLACVEVGGARESVVMSSWGGPSHLSSPSGWQVRPLDPRGLEAVRAVLRLRRGEREVGCKPARARSLPPGFVAGLGSVVSLPALFLPNQGDLGQVRYAAARVRANLLLVVVPSTRTYSYRNGLANLYPLLVGLALPAEEEVVFSRVEAALIDVRTGYVYAVAQGEARDDLSQSPLFGTPEARRELEANVKVRAKGNMLRALRAELKRLELEPLPGSSRS